MTDGLLLLGPTGSGKSALALEVAQRRPVEIISVDSAQVYRGLDIGSAKPSPAERAAVPHHLIDIRDPTERYSAADFVRDAVAAIAGVRGRGKLPLLVGGTMLYAKALRDGLSELPPADASVRAAIDAQARQLGWPALHARLATLDPATAARLSPNDSQRIQRALEVIEVSGRPMSALLTQPASRRPRLDVVALIPADRGELHRRLEQRFDAMLARGFLDEVRALRQRGDLTADLPSMRSVGYRQAWAYLDGHGSHAEFRAAAIAATRRLAKRQLTWLRSLAVDVSIDAPDGSAADLVVRRLDAIDSG
ncbi:MAG TPA: tRNA (adenosine(37)-N6)-dimethylallyltransferase MiaA [Burkholderiaceae bacterium]|nr:tRNA (adenosine(37)-N6)-dimethylallyltransferase MiaA [Burkholderiaceae bacterium]HQR69066.1 tRNA (adenosine(37)-N6)-dimethylallyltransferase MiaA [Burkholderiaceae bacterium]